MITSSTPPPSLEARLRKLEWQAEDRAAGEKQIDRALAQLKRIILNEQHVRRLQRTLEREESADQFMQLATEVYKTRLTLWFALLVVLGLQLWGAR